MVNKRLRLYIVLLLCTVFLFAGVATVYGTLTPPDCPHCAQKSLAKCCQQETVHASSSHAEAATCKHGSLCVVNIDELGKNIVINTQLPLVEHRLRLNSLSPLFTMEIELSDIVIFPPLASQDIHLKNCVFLI